MDIYTKLQNQINCLSKEIACLKNCDCGCSGTTQEFILDTSNTTEPDGSNGASIVSTGYESILVDIQKLKALKPDMINFAVDLRAAWYRADEPIGVLPVEIKAVFYKGGQMIKGSTPFKYSNPTAISSLDVTSNSKQITARYQDDNGVRLQRLAVFKYNIVTNVGTFDINDTITPEI